MLVWPFLNVLPSNASRNPPTPGNKSQRRRKTPGWKRNSSNQTPAICQQICLKLPPPSSWNLTLTSNNPPRRESPILQLSLLASVGRNQSQRHHNLNFERSWIQFQKLSALLIRIWAGHFAERLGTKICSGAIFWGNCCLKWGGKLVN